jgi:hypothetical protein
VTFIHDDDSNSKEIKAKVTRLLCDDDEHLDKLYICRICNIDYLFRLDVEDHKITAGHDCLISIWLDDVIRMDDFQS